MHFSELQIPHLQREGNYITDLRGPPGRAWKVRLAFAQSPLGARGHTASQEQSQDTHSGLTSELPKPLLCTILRG